MYSFPSMPVLCDPTGETFSELVAAFAYPDKVRRKRASLAVRAKGGPTCRPGRHAATMSEIDSPPSVNAHPRVSGRNAHRTDPPTAANHRIGLSPAAAHRLRTFIKLNRPSIRTPTVDALVTSMYVPSGGLEAAHLAETIAAVALNISLANRMSLPWAALVPKDIWLDFVLPYATLNEARSNHRALLRKSPPARVGGIEPPAEVGSGKQSHLGTKRGSDVARICAGPASGCNARALPLPWCRRPSSLP